MRKKTKQRLLMQKGVDRMWWSPERRALRRWRKKIMLRYELAMVKLALSQIRTGIKTLNKLDFPMDGDIYPSDMAAYGRFHAGQAEAYLKEAVDAEKRERENLRGSEEDDSGGEAGVGDADESLREEDA